MAKRFSIPPPLVDGKSLTEKLDVELDTCTPEEALATLQKCGVLPLYNKVRRAWLPGAVRKLNMVSTDVELPDVATEQGKSALEWGKSVCTAMALFYVGRRLGTFHLKVQETNADGSDEPETDGTVMMISATLQMLSDLVGERAAAEIFRRLERVTTRVLRQAPGRSADR